MRARRETGPGVVAAVAGFGMVLGLASVAPDGKTASLRIAPLEDPSCRKIVVHSGPWAPNGSRAARELAPDKPHEIHWSLPRDD